MNEEQRIFDLIEKYHQGTLSHEERLLVEKRMQSDTSFAEYLSLHGLTNKLVEAAGFDLLREKMSSDLAALDRKTNRMKWGIGILTFLLILSSLVYFRNYFRKKNIPGQIEKKQTSPVNSEEKKEVESSTKQEKEIIQNNIKTGTVKTITQPDTAGTVLVAKEIFSETKQEPVIEERKIETNIEASHKEYKPCALAFHLIVQPTCKGEKNGTVSVERGSTEGGTKPYYFLTSYGERSSLGNFSGLGKGNYTITMYDAAGCSASQEFLLSERNCTSRKSYSFNPDYGEKWNADPEGEAGNFTIYNRGGIIIFKGSFTENNPAEWYGTNAQGATMEAGLYVCVLEYPQGKTETIELSIIR